MQGTRVGRRAAVAVLGSIVLLGGCGGGVDFGEGSPFDEAVDPEEATGDDGSGDDGSAFDDVPGAVTAGPVTVSAEPGHAVVTVDGRAIDHTAVGLGGGFRCSISDELINLEVTSEFGSMVLTANRVDDGWIGGFTADSDEDPDRWIQYAVQPFDGELGLDLDAQTLSYVGSAVRQDRDAMSDGDRDTPTVDVTVAVNCGIDPATVVVGGETFTFPLFEADSMTCEVAGPDSIDIIVNYLATENRQLQFDLRPDGDGVIGGVFVNDGGERWSSVISTQEGTDDGLEFDGSTVTYSGDFERTSDADPDVNESVEGTVTVTCPS